MKIAFLTQAVDERDPIQATTVSWLRTLAGKARVESVFVITLHKGVFNLPDNVEVREIRGTTRSRRLGDLYIRALEALHSRIDCFFVHQGGPYPGLLLPFRWLWQKPIFQWCCHPYVNPSTRFFARFVDALVFTATPKSFPLGLANVRVVGHGVDTLQFCEKPVTRDRQLVTIGRVAPRKGLDRVIRAVADLNRRYGTSFDLDIYGPILERDVGYRRSLENLVAELGVADRIAFQGSVEQSKLPNLLNRYRLFLNYSDTALDRAVTEAMACALPVLSTNPCVAEMLPADLRKGLILPRDDMDAQCQRIYQILTMAKEDRTALGRSLREIIVRDHGVESQFDRILDEIEKALGQKESEGASAEG